MLFLVFLVLLPKRSREPFDSGWSALVFALKRRALFAGK